MSYVSFFKNIIILIQWNNYIKKHNRILVVWLYFQNNMGTIIIMLIMFLPNECVNCTWRSRAFHCHNNINMIKRRSWPKALCKKNNAEVYKVGVITSMKTEWFQCCSSYVSLLMGPIYLVYWSQLLNSVSLQGLCCGDHKEENDWVLWLSYMLTIWYSLICLNRWSWSLYDL